MSNLYQEHILDHYSNPRNHREIKNPDIYFRERNPLCGDEIAIFAIVKKGFIDDVSFLARGCAISQASASMLTEAVVHKRLKDVMKMTGKDVIALLSIPVSPARSKCAFLALNALKEGIISFEEKNNGAGN